MDEKVPGVEALKDKVLTEETFEREAPFLECTVKKEKLSEHKAVITKETKKDLLHIANTKKSKKPRTSLVWLSYDTLKDDISTVQCKTCSAKLSRGRLHSSSAGKLGSGSMIPHLKNCNPQGYNRFIEAKKADKKVIFISERDQGNYIYTPKSVREKTSLIWRFFTTVDKDYSKAQCNQCDTRLSRGKLATNMSNASMAPHLKASHQKEYQMYQKAKEEKLALKNDVLHPKLKVILDVKDNKDGMQFNIRKYFEEDESNNSQLSS